MQNDQRWIHYDPHEVIDFHRPQIPQKSIYISYLITLNIATGVESNVVIWL